jgi:hypothetical protein
MKLVRLIKMCLNKMYSKVCISKHLSYNFPIQTGLKRDVLSPLLFELVLQYTIRKVQGNQIALELNGTHQLLAYADDVNLLGDNVYTVHKNTETLIDASKEVGLEINRENVVYVANLVTRMQVKIADSSFENVSQFKYLEMTLTSQNWILEELKRRFNSGNAYYHSVQNLLSSRLLSKNKLECARL